MRCYLSFCLLICILLASCGQKKQAKLSQTSPALLAPFDVGFKMMKAVDSFRIYKPDSKPTDTLHFRPLDIDVWYPARKGVKDSILRFTDLLGLLEKRANHYSAPKTYIGITIEIAQSFCEFFKCSTPDTLLQYKTSSRHENKYVAGKFPLIIYMTSYNGMSYENFTLFESLARQGYIVAVVSSIGRYPGEMTMKTADLMQQVEDAAFILTQMKRIEYVDSTKIGLIGYSWGGFAGAILAMQRPQIKAVVSFDGSEFHHYRQAEAEDEDFEATIKSPFFQQASLSVPYLRLESHPQGAGSKKDSVYNFLSKLKAETGVFKVTSATHQDFSCLPLLVKSAGHCPTSSIHATITDLTIGYFDQHLKQQPNVFTQKIKAQLGKTITKVLP